MFFWVFFFVFMNDRLKWHSDVSKINGALVTALLCLNTFFLLSS